MTDHAALRIGVLGAGLIASTWRADRARAGAGAGAGTLLEHSIDDVDMRRLVVGDIVRVELCHD